MAILCFLDCVKPGDMSSKAFMAEPYIIFTYSERDIQHAFFAPIARSQFLFPGPAILHDS